MKKLKLGFITLALCISAVAQTPKAVVPPPVTIKMPEARSTELKALQAQADKLEAAMREIQLRASALITRAALEAKMSVEQLDAMELGLDAKGNYEWRPKPPTPVKTP